jgi:hypothetical protein
VNLQVPNITLGWLLALAGAVVCLVLGVVVLAGALASIPVLLLLALIGVAFLARLF